MDIAHESVLRSLELMWIKCTEKPAVNLHIHTPAAGGARPRFSSIDDNTEQQHYEPASSKISVQLRDYYVNTRFVLMNIFL
jgi:hypothetical protein